MTLIVSQCWICKNASKEVPGCKAFPEKIPKDFFFGKRVHLKPSPGGNGLMFEPKDEECLFEFIRMYGGRSIQIPEDLTLADWSSRREEIHAMINARRKAAGKKPV
jgi:hypothetical protein